MKTETASFIDMLHRGRDLKRRNIHPVVAKSILLGMKWAYLERLEDIKAGHELANGR